MTTTHALPPEPGAASYHVAGLDGIRAIAVVLVIVFHLGPGALVGGYLGVDVFFVVSGFLITTLLLREKDASGGIRLGAFWARRARRLLPALAALLLICSTAAYFVGGDVLVGLGRQLLGAATFSTNWLLLASGSGYFGDTLPELFRNLWSLAVEEQFYLVWAAAAGARPAPDAGLAPHRAHRPCSPRDRPPRCGWLVDPADTSRVYYGTDTHAFGLAIGSDAGLRGGAPPRDAARWHAGSGSGCPSSPPSPSPV